MFAKHPIKALLCLLGLSCWPGVQAATSCRLSVNPVSFDTYDVFSTTRLDGQGDVQVTCARDPAGPSTANIDVTLSAGRHASVVESRGMRRTGSNLLFYYQIYQDAGRTTIWGATTGVDSLSRQITVSKTRATVLILPMYGSIPAGQDLSAGSYTDRLVVTVTP